MIPLAMAWIGDNVPYEQRQAVLARFLIGQICGLACGQTFGGLAAEQDWWQWPFLVYTVLFAAASGLLWYRVGRHERPQGRKPESLGVSLRHVLQKPWPRVVLISVFFEGAAGKDPQRLNAVLCLLHIALVAQRPAFVLIVGDVVAPSAPGVKQPAALAGGLVEQLGSGSETVRALLDRIERFLDQHSAIATTPGPGRSGTHVARLDESAGLAQRSSAFIWKMGVCGSYDAILSISPASAVSCTRIF